MDSISGGSTSRRDEDEAMSSGSDFASGGSTETEISLSRRVLVNYYRQCTSNKDSDKMQYLCEEVKGALNIEISSEMKSTLSKLVHIYKQKLAKSHRNFDRCLNNNKDWFDSAVTFVVSRKRRSGSLGGRPKKEFDECSERAKRQKTEEIRNRFTSSELCYAAQMNLRATGELEKSKAVKAAAAALENCDLKKTPQLEHLALSPEKALSLLIEGQLTKHQYNLFRSTALEANCKLYPNYETVTDAKKRCYPSGMLFTEATAEVPLKNLLNHTVERLLLSLNDVIVSLDDNKKNKLCLISKWGCDGSGSHSQYKQKFEEADLTDQYMFISSIVPIRLYYQDEDNRMHLVWQNPRPSSPRYCRPLKLQMAQETSALTVLHAENVKTQIALLTPTNGDNYTERHDLKLTMVDGKVVNAITGTKSAMRCYLCGLTSKDFNRMKHAITRPIKKENFEYGLSTLHAWIRFADCILHLSYKLKHGKWRSTKECESTIQAEKKRIQNEFWEKLQLHVDEPRQGGGTSTDGNTARKIFQNARVTAEITGFNLNIIERFHTVLKVISSGYKIKTEKFKDFCLQTAAAYVFIYPWYPMPTTMHKILIHGPEIIDFMNVAIGLLCEDAQESRNKDIRNFREHFTRKFSRTICMTDTFQRLMVSSDPYITSLRKLTPQKGSILTTLDLSLLDEETEI